MPDYTPKSYFEEKIAQKLKDKPETSKAVNSIYEFNITGENGGVWTVDLTKEPGTVQAGSTGTPPCTVPCAANAFLNLASGKLDPQMAFGSVGPSVRGDMGLCLTLEPALGGAPARPSRSS